MDKEPDNVLIAYALEKLLGETLTPRQLADIMGTTDDHAFNLIQEIDPRFYKPPEYPGQPSLPITWTA